MDKNRVEKANRLNLLVDFLNQNIDSPYYKDLHNLINLPHKEVIGETPQGGQRGGLTPTTRGAMFSTYWDCLQMLVQKLNQQLNTNLNVAFGDHQLWEYRSNSKDPPMFFPLHAEKGELKEMLSERGQKIPNPAVRRKSDLGEGIIKTRWGKFIVEGQFPKFNDSLAIDWLIADSLISGQFSLLRQCRWCKKVFVIRDVRNAFCGDKCRTLYGSAYRMAEKKKRDNEENAERQREKQEQIERQAEQAAKKRFRQFLMDEIKDRVTLNALLRRVGGGDERSGLIISNRWYAEAKKKGGIDLVWKTLPHETQKIFYSV